MSPELIQQIIIAILGVIGGGLGVAGVNYYSNKGKNSAEARNINITGEITLSQGYKALLEDLRKEKDAKIKELELEVEHLNREIGRLTRPGSTRR